MINLGTFDVEQDVFHSLDRLFIVWRIFGNVIAEISSRILCVALISAQEIIISTGCHFVESVLIKNDLTRIVLTRKSIIVPGRQENLPLFHCLQVHVNVRENYYPSRTQ
jgi:hypothetical protein